MNADPDHKRSRKDQAVLDALVLGQSVTPLEAMNWTPRNLRLAGSIHRLREEGAIIERRWITAEDGQRFASYVLVRLASDAEGVDRRNPPGLRQEGNLPWGS